MEAAKRVEMRHLPLISVHIYGFLRFAGVRVGVAIWFGRYVGVAIYFWINR